MLSHISLECLIWVSVLTQIKLPKVVGSGEKKRKEKKIHALFFLLEASGKK